MNFSHAKNIASAITGALIIGVSILAVYAPSHPFFRTMSEYNVQLVFGLLGLGLFFLIIDQFRLLAISFSCCAMLCIFLKSASYDKLVFPKPNTTQQLSISQVNIANVNYNYDLLVEALLQEDPDVISFQEITPIWNQLLQEDFAIRYPYFKTVVRIDPYGLAIYSKIPLENIDTFHTQHIPHITCTIKLDNEKVQLFTSYITPALNEPSADKAKAQLHKITSKIKACPHAAIALGDFNMVHWTPEMMSFKNNALLSNSRRESSANPNDVPYEHIFFSKEIECVEFKNLEADDYLGITGSYQYKQNNRELSPYATDHSLTSN